MMVWILFEIVIQTLLSVRKNGLLTFVKWSSWIF
jgi:hypothetical protein